MQYQSHTYVTDFKPLVFLKQTETSHVQLPWYSSQHAHLQPHSHEILLCQRREKLKPVVGVSEVFDLSIGQSQRLHYLPLKLHRPSLRSRLALSTPITLQLPIKGQFLTNEALNKLLRTIIKCSTRLVSDIRIRQIL